jgi:ribosomal RNA-processing protein 8
LYHHQHCNDGLIADAGRGTFHIAEVTSRFISIPAFISKVQSFGFKLESQKAPSTHFTLFEFTKESSVPLGAARGEQAWIERVAEGEEILRGCVYKKR